MTASRRVAAALLVPILVVLSGCVKYKASYEIVSEDQIKVTVDTGLDKSSEAAAGTTKEEMCAPGGESSGPTLKDEKREPYDDGTYIGCRISGTATVSQMGEELEIRKQDDGTWLFQQMGSSDEDSGQSAAMFDSFEVSVTFPGKVLSHNGSSTVSGKTVTWTNPNDLFSTDGLRATGEDGGGLSAVPLVIGVLVIAAALGGFLFYNNAQKKKKAAAAAQAAQSQQWGQGYGQQGGYDQYGQQGGGWNQGGPQQGGHDQTGQQGWDQHQQYPPQGGQPPQQGGWNQGGPQQGGWG